MNLYQPAKLWHRSELCAALPDRTVNDRCQALSLDRCTDLHTGQCPVSVPWNRAIRFLPARARFIADRSYRRPRVPPFHHQASAAGVDRVVDRRGVDADLVGFGWGGTDRAGLFEFVLDVTTRAHRRRVGARNRWYVAESGFWKPGRHLVCP